MRCNMMFAVVLGFLAVSCKSTQSTPENKNVENVEIVSETMTTSGLENVQWKLVEVVGKPVSKYGELNKEPIFIFEASSKRLSGNAGCNNMSASYELLEGNRIEFSQAISTKMACPNMELEDQVGQMLSTLDTYIINDAGELILTKARMAPMLRFVPVR